MVSDLDKIHLSSGKNEGEKKRNQTVRVDNSLKDCCCKGKKRHQQRVVGGKDEAKRKLGFNGGRGRIAAGLHTDQKGPIKRE
jgi:hypothetical protein